MNNDDCGDRKLLFFGKASVWPEMTVMEFLVGMSLCRRGPLSSAGVAADVSKWFDKAVEAVELMPSLMGIVERGWAKVEAGLFAIVESGIDAIRGFYAVMVRLLDGGRGLLDVAVLMSLVREFEGRER